MFSSKEKPIIATVPSDDNESWESKIRRSTPMTEAQGERIIKLLEQLVEQAERPAPLPPGPALDKAIAEDIKRHSISYPGGY